MVRLRAVGSYHQGIIGRYAGNQCTLIAMFALAAAFLHPMANWQRADIDNALLFGNDLYSNFIDERNCQPYHVAHDELINMAPIPVQIASLQADLYPVRMHHGILFGVIGSVLPNYEAGTLNFEMALEESITMSPYALVTIGGMAVAIHGDGNNFSVFDSHARNSHGKWTSCVVAI